MTGLQSVGIYVTFRVGMEQPGLMAVEDRLHAWRIC